MRVTKRDHGADVRGFSAMEGCIMRDRRVAGSWAWALVLLVGLGLMSGGPIWSAAAQGCAETVNWIWMKGSSTTGQSGTYGTLGSPSAANIPGARAFGVSWTDPSGGRWLFGGYNGGRFSDLWKCDPVTGYWTWMKGPSTTGHSGTYGTPGTPNRANNPGARTDSAAWTDLSGNLWLFGGFGFDVAGTEGRLNDLWKYEPTTGNWTWMKGASTADQSGVYGMLGTAAADNTPGARQSVVSWIDALGKLWVFGGLNGAYLNDLWKYDPATGDWTWMEGPSTVNESGSYGTPGTPEAANIPGARFDSTSWTDASGKVWVFGGYGYTTGADAGFLNDLWKYDPATGFWTWIKGAQTINPLGTYGTLGTPGSANTPGGRTAAVTWTDTSGKLWLFSGAGYGAAGNTGFLNDLWRYDPAAGNWTWIKGASAPDASGTYGTRGNSAAANTPGGRCQAVSWTDASGGLWVFGGYNWSYFNDLWRADTAVLDSTPPVITLSGANPVVVECHGAYSDAGATAEDNCAGNLTAGIVVTNPVNVNVPDSYTVRYNLDDGNGNSAIQAVRTVNVVDRTPPVLTLLGTNPVNVECHGAYTDAGATAMDSCDGDQTENVITDNPVNIDLPGAYTVTYDVVDNNGNPAVQLARTVNVVDTTPPVITLHGANPVAVECHSVHVDAGATATDNCGGDWTAHVVAGNPVNMNIPGTYTVTYDAVDDAGNHALRAVRTVSVVDTTPPVITLLGSTTVTVESHGSYTDAGATAMDACAGDRTANIVTGNPVNVDTPGTYTVTYDVSDENGNHAAQLRRFVKVADTPPQSFAISYVASPPEGGTVTGPDTVVAGGTAAVTVSANPGYHLAAVAAGNGAMTGTAPYQLSNMTADTTVTATFVRTQLLVTVPDLTGMPVSQAWTVLIGAGLMVSVAEESSDTVPVGQVIRQTPAAGIQVALGTQVGLTVSSGPENAGCNWPGSKNSLLFVKLRKILGDLFLGGPSLMLMTTPSYRSI